MSQRANFVRGEIDNQTLCDDESLAPSTAEFGKHLAPRTCVRKIQTDSLQRAHRLAISENILLVLKNSRQIYFNPLQRRRQIHSIRSRVQSSRQIDHEVATSRDFLGDEMIEEVSARDP